jgi:hypothetical protein
MNDYLITAAEVRKMGFAIPKGIPDFATIPRDSMVPRPDVTVERDVTEETKLNVSITVEFTEPFRWCGGYFELRRV